MKPFFKQFKDPIWIISFSQFFTQLVNLAFFPYFAMFLQKNGFGLDTICTLIFIKELMKLVGMFLGGTCADWPGYKSLTALAFLLSSMGYFLLSISKDPSFLLIGFSVAGFFYGFAYPGESKLIINFKNQWDLKKVYSLGKICMMIAAITAPLIGTAFAIKHPHIVALVSGVYFLLYSSVIFFLLPIPRPARLCEFELRESSRDSTIGEGTCISSIQASSVIVEPREALLPRATGYLSVLQNFPFVKLVLCLLVLMTCRSILFTSLPLYLENNFKNGVDLYSIVLSINAWIVITLQIAVNKFLSKIKSNNHFLYGNILYCIVFLLLSLLYDSSWAIIILFTFFSLIELMVMPTAYSLIIEFSHTESLGKHQAFANLRFVLATLISSILGKLFVNYHSFYFFSYFILTLIFTPLFLSIRDKTKYQENKGFL